MVSLTSTSVFFFLSFFPLYSLLLHHIHSYFFTVLRSLFLLFFLLRTPLSFSVFPLFFVSSSRGNEPTKRSSTPSPLFREVQLSVSSLCSSLCSSLLFSFGFYLRTLQGTLPVRKKGSTRVCSKAREFPTNSRVFLFQSSSFF